MKESWDTNIYGTPLYKVVRKLSVVKKSLIEWQKLHFSLPTKLSEAALKLENLQQYLVDDPGNMDIQDQERMARFDLDHLL